ncbi:hypothetical protein [Streptomyces anulatus]|uniref:hypothetical protein n=1 Tax=Streptomyces anulatus TaxID=1892 RepID=UPI00386A3FC8
MDTAVKRAHEHFGRLDVVVINAGITGVAVAHIAYELISLCNDHSMNTPPAPAGPGSWPQNYRAAAASPLMWMPNPRSFGGMPQLRTECPS